MSARLLPLALAAVWLAGCPAAVTDPPPPPSKPEIVPAPPRALGALAAGTDAAPRPDRALGVGVEGLPSLPLPPGHGRLPAPGAGGSGPGGSAPGTGDPAASGEPDGGMAL